MRLVELTAGDGSVLIEVSSSDDAIVPVNAVGETIAKLETSLVDRLHGILRIADVFRDELKRLKDLEKAEIEFGFGITAKGSLYVVETGTDATFKVKLIYGTGVPNVR